MKTLRYFFEYVLVRSIMAVFAVLPLDTASALGGMIGQSLGPLTGIHRKTRKQILMIFPTLTEDQARAHIKMMWNNLGRVIAEYPHLPRIMDERLVIENRSGQTVDQIRHGAGLFIGGHFANWEVAGPAWLRFTGEPLNLVYRAANNPWVDRLLQHYRSMRGRLPTIAKSRAGARAIFASVARGEKVGILIDQKYTGGIVADFFGRPAKSTALYAQLGQRFSCPVYPVQIVRTNGAHFRLVLYPALRLVDADGAPRGVEDVVTEAHALLFEWVRANPGQWLWVHQRWSSPGLPGV